MLSPAEGKVFEDWIEEVKKHLKESYRESDLRNFLIMFWNQWANLKEPPRARNAAEAFIDDQHDAPERMVRCKNGSEYKLSQCGQNWCPHCKEFHYGIPCNKRPKSKRRA